MKKNDDSKEYHDKLGEMQDTTIFQQRFGDHHLYEDGHWKQYAFIHVSNSRSQRLWYPVLLSKLKEYYPEILDYNWEQLLDLMEDLHQEIFRYVIRHNINTPKISCRVTTETSPKISLTVRKMIKGLEELRLITPKETKQWLSRWNSYRKKHRLDSKGGRRFKLYITKPIDE